MEKENYLIIKVKQNLKENFQREKNGMEKENIQMGLNMRLRKENILKQIKFN